MEGPKRTKEEVYAQLDRQVRGLLDLDQLAEPLSALSPHGERVCQRVLDLCWSGMERLSAEAKESWLDRLYTHLTDNLFPDEATGHGASPLRPDEVLYLTVLELVLSWKEASWDPLLDLLPVPEEALAHSRVRDQYLRFDQAVAESHLVALMRIGREIMPFDPASHTIGVHNVALHTAKLACKAGIPVDLPLVSGAALGHDVGKFGCRGEDARRIPYLHYYYTWQWFSQLGMEEIGYISANHSTWDLEFENLPIESLLLIYADFRVRGTRGENGREQMAIYTLDEAYEMVFSKLYNMTPEKQRRYQTVYYKLRDFEAYLRSNGVPTRIGEETLQPVSHRDPSLLSDEEALQELRNMTLANATRLMRMVTTDESFDLLLEQAKSEKNLPQIRTYLHLLAEYSTYLTAANKKKTLALLYELLMHPEGDVRQTAGRIMGLILANSGPKYRKERPISARKGAVTPTMMALLDEAVALWEHYILLCLHPDRKVSAKHAMRISNALKTICQSLFSSCDAKEAQPLLQPLLRQLWQAEEGDRFVLVDALSQVPWELLPEDALVPTVEALGRMLPSGEVRLQLNALRCLEQLRQHRPSVAPLIQEKVLCFYAQPGEFFLALDCMRRRALGRPMQEIRPEEVSDFYLSNLKNAVHWTVKLVQIDLLCDYADHHPESAFHTAMHLSNLLSVSEHRPVRQYAGQRLLDVCRLLTVSQINEITIDLLRELESGQDQISRFIPPYAGQIICMLPDKELLEAVSLLENFLQSGSVRPARTALYTLAEILNARPDHAVLTKRVLGVVMRGISHYHGEIHRTALVVLCREIFGSQRISLEHRCQYFVLLHKKLLTILNEPRKGKLTFFNRAAMLNSLYRFLVACEVQWGAFSFPAPKPAAFFPGTFDPFSVGHKKIVEEIRALGFQVYLAVDEFSWSKRTLAKLQRRQIVVMSVADQWDTYLFPDDIPVNIANPDDLARLRQLMGGTELYLVAGSDVIRNASAYRSPEPGSAAEYNHIIFHRDQEGQEAAPLESLIRGKLVKVSLPSFFETVSSTRIREYVDRDLDISMLVDPMVQSFIYDNGLYVRTPERKNILRREDLFFRQHRGPSQDLPGEMNQLLSQKKGALGVVLRVRPQALMGWAVGHTLHGTDLYEGLQSIQAANYVRRHTSGRILLVDVVSPESAEEMGPSTCRMLLNELLARSLEYDHTYAVCPCAPDNAPLRYALDQLGFVPVSGQTDIFYVDMRSPVMLLQDVMLRIKKPHHDSDAVKEVVARTRPKLRQTLTDLFPGKLLLCFDSEMLNQSLMERIEALNGVQDVPAGVRRLGPYMCVPYGKILADEIVPNTVTKTLHVEKCFHPNMDGFEIVEYPGYSPLRNQVRTLKSFRRPVILVDDLLHRGFRIEQLDRLMKEEGLSTQRLIVAVMSGYGRDLMQVQGRKVDCEYFIPNLHYWVTESLLYPFLGGDSIGQARPGETLPRSINLILPYIYPNYLVDATDQGVRALSQTALENAAQILKTLEEEHQQQFNTALTLGRLGEAVLRPRLPDKGGRMKYDLTLATSVYLEADLKQLQRISRKEGLYYDV